MNISCVLVPFLYLRALDFYLQDVSFIYKIIASSNFKDSFRVKSLLDKASSLSLLSMDLISWSKGNVCILSLLSSSLHYFLISASLVSISTQLLNQSCHLFLLHFTIMDLTEATHFQPLILKFGKTMTPLNTIRN